MEKTTMRSLSSLFLLVIITGSIFTACGPEVKAPAVVDATATVVPPATTTPAATVKQTVTVPSTTVTTAPVSTSTTPPTTTPAPAADSGANTLVPAQPVSTPAPTPVKVSTKYKDGTYTKTGLYQAPSGSESVTVTVTVKGDKVDSLNVVGNATNDISVQFQTKFIAGVSGLVVGKKLDDVGSIGVVNGSSLTATGFNDAIASIETSAQQ